MKNIKLLSIFRWRFFLPQTALFVFIYFAYCPWATAEETKQQSAGPDISLTDNEKKWLDQHRVIVFSSDPTWPPFEFVNEAKGYHGIGSEYIDILSQTLDVDFQFRPAKSWTEALSQMKEKNVSLLPMLASTEKRMETMNFTKPYLSLPMVILTRDDFDFVSDVYSFDSLKLGVNKNSAVNAYLDKNYPDQKLFLPNSNEEGLQALSNGKIDGFVANIASATYIIRKNNIKNIKVSGAIPFRLKLCIGVRKDWPELIPILNKALDTIPSSKKTQINSFWINVQYRNRVDWPLILGISFALISVCCIIIYIYKRSNRKLIQEINYRKKIENQLIKSQEFAETANRAKSNFLANMSHDIRTPMNSILGFSGVMLNSDLEDKEKGRQYLGYIHSSGETLLALINNILDITQVEEGKLELEFIAVDIRKVISDIETMFMHDFQQKGLEFIVDIDSRLPRFLLLDESRLKQILINLVGNAIKFTEFGSVTIKAVKEDNLEKSDHFLNLKLSVIDTGIGIPKDQFENIFRSFEQVSNQSFEKYGGTGLGLAICKNLSELMNGSIKVESQEGQGSRFIFLLKDVRILDESTLETEAKNHHVYNFRKARILIADDLHYNLCLIKNYFKDCPFELSFSESGEEAITASAKTKFDLILMDYRFEGMSGLEAAKKIKMEHDVPIIMITASAMKDEEEMILKICDMYIKKPVDKDELLKKVEQALE